MIRRNFLKSLAGGTMVAAVAKRLALADGFPIAGRTVLSHPLYQEDRYQLDAGRLHIVRSGVLEFQSGELILAPLYVSDPDGHDEDGFPSRTLVRRDAPWASLALYDVRVPRIMRDAVVRLSEGYNRDENLLHLTCPARGPSRRSGWMTLSDLALNPASLTSFKDLAADSDGWVADLVIHTALLDRSGASGLPSTLAVR